MFLAYSLKQENGISLLPFCLWKKSSTIASMRPTPPCSVSRADTRSRRDRYTGVVCGPDIIISSASPHPLQLSSFYGLSLALPPTRRVIASHSGYEEPMSALLLFEGVMRCFCVPSSRVVDFPSLPCVLHLGASYISLVTSLLFHKSPTRLKLLRVFRPASCQQAAELSSNTSRCDTRYFSSGLRRRHATASCACLSSYRW